MDEGRRRALNAYVLREWWYAISPITMIELLAGIHDSGDQYWQENKTRFAVLMDPDPTAQILGLPQEFVAQRVFGKEPDPDSGYAPEMSRLWFELIAAAGSRKELLDGVHSTTMGAKLPFVSAVVKGEVVRMKDKLRDVMTEYRARHQSGARVTFVLGDLKEESDDGIPSQRMWTASLLHGSGIAPTPDAIDTAMPRTDAAYRYQRWLYENAAGTYKFENDLSAASDVQQLLYLSDESVHIVSDDGDHVERTKDTPQRSQILTTAEFLARAGV